MAFNPHIHSILSYLNFENILVLSMGQTRVLEIREEEKVWYDEEPKKEHPFHWPDTVMQNDERRNSLEAISQTCAGTESGHKLLWNGFDVTDYSRFANGAAALKD